MIEQELWRPLKFRGVISENYLISSYGQVKNKLTNRLLKLQDSGYLHIRIRHNGVYTNVRIHRAVCETFNERPEGCDYVNHKDSDKKNNHASNLEWTTQRENVIHSYNKRKEEVA